MRDVSGDLLHGQRRPPACAWRLDDGAAVEAADQLARGRHFVLRLEHAALALDPAPEALRGLGAQPRRVVLEVMVERRGALTR